MRKAASVTHRALAGLFLVGAVGAAFAANDERARVAPAFDGRTGYVEIPSAEAFSRPEGGAITIEVWIRPSTLTMPASEMDGYVHFLGKGGPRQHEWTFRMYQTASGSDRGHRISFYAYNPAGGLGVGSFFQDDLEPNHWIHVAGVIDAETTSIYRDGVRRDCDDLAVNPARTRGCDGLSARIAPVVPSPGQAPVRIGTRDMKSFFQGSISRVAIYAGRLEDAIIRRHHELGASAKGDAAYDADVLGNPALAGYWKLDENKGSVAFDKSPHHRDGAYHGGVELAGARW
jgi:hypothetical protein